MVKAFVALADTLVGDYDLLDYLEALASAVWTCCAWLPRVSCWPTRRLRLRPLAASSEQCGSWRSSSPNTTRGLAWTPTRPVSR